MNKYYLGMDLGGTNIKAAVYGEDFQQVAEKRAPTQVERGWEHVLSRMAEAAALLLEERKLAPEQVRALGIGVPGLLDMERGISRFSPNFYDWQDVPVARWMEQRLRIPVFIDNDVRVNLYGEWLFGAGKGKRNIVLLTLGTGLGAAVVLDNRMLYGQSAGAGEIGHMNMYREGRPCKCGSSGCLGRYVSALGMLRTVREKLQEGRDSVLLEWCAGDRDGISAKMVSEAYDRKDAVAVEALRETGELLGFGLVNAINLFNPEIVIIGGGMADAGDRLLRWAREVIGRRALQINREACKVVQAQLGDGAGMLGAAVYAKRRLEKEARL